MECERLLPHYRKAIDKIDDFFEYRYLRVSSDECKSTVMGIIDTMTDNIKEEMMDETQDSEA